MLERCFSCYNPSYTPWSKYMARSPKGRLIQGLYKPIHGNSAIYFYPGVTSRGPAHLGEILLDDSNLKFTKESAVRADAKNCRHCWQPWSACLWFVQFHQDNLTVQWTQISNLAGIETKFPPLSTEPWLWMIMVERPYLDIFGSLNILRLVRLFFWFCAQKTCASSLLCDRSFWLSIDAFWHVPTDNVRRKGNAHSALYRSIKQAGGAAVAFSCLPRKLSLDIQKIPTTSWKAF